MYILVCICVCMCVWCVYVCVYEVAQVYLMTDEWCFCGCMLVCMSVCACARCMYVYVYVVALDHMRMCWYVGEGVDAYENDIKRRRMHSKRNVQKRGIYSPSYLAANGKEKQKL